jgi:hypothetical protein
MILAVDRSRYPRKLPTRKWGRRSAVENSVENGVRPAPKFWSHLRPNTANRSTIAVMTTVVSTPVSNMLSGLPWVGLVCVSLTSRRYWRYSRISRAGSDTRRTLARRRGLRRGRDHPAAGRILGCPKSGDDAVDRLFATRKGIGRMLCGIAGHAVDPDQVRPTTAGELNGTFTDLLALGVSSRKTAMLFQLDRPDFGTLGSQSNFPGCRDNAFLAPPRSESGHLQRFDNLRAWSGQPHTADLSKNSPSMRLSA